MRQIRGDDRNFGVGGVHDEDGETSISVSVHRDTGRVIGLMSDETVNQNRILCEHFFCEEHQEEHWIAVGVIQVLNDAQMGDPVEFPVPIHVEGGLEQGLEEARKMANEDLLKKIEKDDDESTEEAEG